MTGKRRNSIGLGAATFIMALTVAAATPQSAGAQGLFGTLFGGFREHDSSRDRAHELPRSRHDSRVTAYASHGNGYENRSTFRFPFDFRPREQRPAASAAAPSGGSGVNCVRLCDGRYFPLPRTSGATRLDPVKVCSALCPAAKTKVFNGGNMQYARASDGTRYADLDNAFTFREKIVPDCSCTGKSPGGLAQIDIESDPTLRAGDIVVTASGPTVFAGSREFPYKTADFTPVEDYAKINKTLRETLSELQVNTGVTPVIPPQKIATTAAPEEKAAEKKRVRRVVRTHAPDQVRAYAAPEQQRIERRVERRGPFGWW